MNTTYFAKITVTALAMGSILSLTACQTMTKKLSNISIPSFQKEQTPEPRYIPKLVQGAKKSLLIAPVRVPCNTQKPMQCMVATIDNGNKNIVFKIPYNWIEGFTPQVNMAYKISASPMMDQNNNNQETGQWRLDSILLQKPVR